MYTINYVCYLNLLLCHHFKVVVLYSTALNIIFRSYYLMKKSDIIHIFYVLVIFYQRYCLCKTLETHSKSVISIVCINPTVLTVMDIGTRV